LQNEEAESRPRVVGPATIASTPRVQTQEAAAEIARAPRSGVARQL
jgi:hypothetical protein